MGGDKKIKIEIVYALPHQAHCINLMVPAGTTLEQAIKFSGIMDKCPGIDISVNKVGIFGRLKGLDTPLKEGDRIEIYRSLKADPKEARRKRAKKTVIGD
jgi:uncharacterized protein